MSNKEMKPRLGDVASIGLVHHMLYPGIMTDPDLHESSLDRFIQRTDIDTFDYCLPYDSDRRTRLISKLRQCKLDHVYATHLFPLRKISFASTCVQEQGLIRLALEDTIEAAHQSGASGLIFASGADVSEPDRPVAREAFADFCRWLCRQLKDRGMIGMLEPFDRTFDKKFLYGPTSECVDLIRSLEPDIDNLRIELDIAHLPLMGEGFDVAIKTVAPYLARVHLGNCVMSDPDDPFYGDKHPPIGYKGGEIDTERVAEALGALLRCGYLDSTNRGALLIECQPFPGRSAEETALDNLGRLEAAWNIAIEQSQRVELAGES
jgi:sugar phosphate isomerase/epimerase